MPTFYMYARPLPTEPPPAEFEQLKYVFGRRYWNHDGTLPGLPIIIKPGAKMNAYLQGLRDANPNSDLSSEVLTMIALLDENPQGISVWIGNEDDH